MSTLRVTRLDCLVLVEDLGRPGFAHLGVPRSGALDTTSLGLANRLVGNPDGHAALEILLGGLALVANGSTRVALSGAQLRLRVDGRAAPWGTSVSVASGSTIEIDPSRDGLRAWLAVAGGIDVPAVLGSRSTDTLSGLGPKPVTFGDVLPVGSAGAVTDAAATGVPLAATGSPLDLRLRPGPREDWFTGASLDTVFRSDLRVSSSADRVAIRLVGEPLVRAVAAELASEGLVSGAVQVPPDGQPLVFLADHPTTGGYPVVGVVVPDDLGRCAQLRPGDLVRLRPAR